MGFFSFITTDTNHSIYNCNTKKCFTVYLIDNKGNRWVEPEYEGYGEFGGKDIYVLFAEMNGIEVERDHEEEEEDFIESIREAGINAWFSDDKFDKGYIYPNLVQNCELEWSNKKLEHCPNQGYFA